MARRVVAACRGADCDVLVVTSDSGVAAWAEGMDVRTIPDPPEGGLNGAAATGAAWALARGHGFAVVHGDLPLVAPEDVNAAVELLTHSGAVIAPSRDGGTNLLAARAPLPFRYGPGSFRRHLAAASALAPRVLVRLGLVVDLDTAADLAAASSLPAGAWLAEPSDLSGG
jgi:2-phospho-L-lactate guanylyltransferase